MVGRSTIRLHCERSWTYAIECKSISVISRYSNVQLRSVPAAACRLMSCDRGACRGFLAVAQAKLNPEFAVKRSQVYDNVVLEITPPALFFASSTLGGREPSEENSSAIDGCIIVFGKGLLYEKIIPV